METQTEIYVNTNSDNGSLPDGNKPLSEKNVNSQSVRFCSMLCASLGLNVLRGVVYASRGIGVLNVYYMPQGPQCVEN